MHTRRGFVGCLLCALAAFSATDAGAENAQTPGVTRTIINRTDGPTSGYETVEVKAEIPASGMVARQTHPGLLSGRCA